MKTPPAALTDCRLKEPRRHLLVRLAEAGDELVVAEGRLTAGRRWSLLVAAHGLADRGLVELRRCRALVHDPGRTRRFGPRRLHARLTALGRAVVAFFRRELATGRQVRWVRFRDACASGAVTI